VAVIPTTSFLAGCSIRPLDLHQNIPCVYSASFRRRRVYGRVTGTGANIEAIEYLEEYPEYLALTPDWTSMAPKSSAVVARKPLSPLSWNAVSNEKSRLTSFACTNGRNFYDTFTFDGDVCFSDSKWMESVWEWSSVWDIDRWLKVIQDQFNASQNESDDEDDIMFRPVCEEDFDENVEYDSEEMYYCSPQAVYSVCSGQSRKVEDVLKVEGQLARLLLESWEQSTRTLFFRLWICAMTHTVGPGQMGTLLQMLRAHLTRSVEVEACSPSGTRGMFYGMDKLLTTKIRVESQWKYTLKMCYQLREEYIGEFCYDAHLCGLHVKQCIEAMGVVIPPSPVSDIDLS
jgi:hypothetical protein